MRLCDQILSSYICHLSIGKFLLALFTVFFFALVPWWVKKLEELSQGRKCTGITRRTFSTRKRLNTIAFCSPRPQQNISSQNFYLRAGSTAEILKLPMCSSIHNSNWKLTHLMCQVQEQMKNVKLSNVCYDDFFDKQHLILLKHLYQLHKHVVLSSWENRLPVLSDITWQLTGMLLSLDWP